jgi:hypothetical protein
MIDENLTSGEAAIVAKALELSDRFERDAVRELRALAGSIPDSEIKDFLSHTTQAVRDDREHSWSVSHRAFELILRAFSPGADKWKRPEESPIGPAWQALADGLSGCLDTNCADCWLPKSPN